MTQETTFGVAGMTCGACVARVEKRLNKSAGVESASVNLTTEQARIAFDAGRGNLNDVLASVENAGYEPVTATSEFRVGGMTCGFYVARVEKKLQKLAGVLDASVNLTTERASVTYLPGTTGEQHLFDTVAKAGYAPAPLEAAAAKHGAEADEPNEADTLRRSLTLGAILTVPLFIIAMRHMAPGIGGAMDSLLPARGWLWIELALATPVQFYAGRRFYKLGWGELKHLAPGMNSLVMLGSNAAYFYSLVALLAPQVSPSGTAHTYFDAAGMIVTLILLGRYLEALAAQADALAQAGKTPLFTAVDGEPAALIAVADPAKRESRATIKTLHKLNLEVAMLTGDNRATAEAIANELGIDRVVAEVMPDGKTNEIKRLQGENKRVAFVGDGINDAPALAQVELGIAIGSGTDVAIEAGDVVLMRSDLTGVVNAIALARATMGTIRMNFIWAYGYNLVLIPLAAGALFPSTGWLLNPMIAAGAMRLSSVFVLTNSLRLKRFRAALAPIERRPLARGERDRRSPGSGLAL